jgi:hypothetical protein
MEVYPPLAGTASLDPGGSIFYPPPPMRSLRRQTAFPLALIFCLTLGALIGQSNAQSELNAPPMTIADGAAGIVVLQDGGVLSGTITRAADWYVVGHSGGEMQIPSSRVLVVCGTLHEAYDYRRQHTTQATPDSHLALAEWCLRNDLAEEAQCEIKTARDLGASDARLTLLDRRLAATKERLNRQPTATPPSEAQPSAAEQSVPSAITPELRDGVLELFTRRVQPILVNNCTVSKCHQPGGPESFQLNRALLRGEANRRSTMQNLSATLALVDRTHPELSQLLTVPRQTHGGMSGPIFGPRQEQAFKHLADWVAMVVPPKPEAEAKPPAEAAPNSPAVTTTAAIAAVSPVPLPPKSRLPTSRTAVAHQRATPKQLAVPAALDPAGAAIPKRDTAVEPASYEDAGMPTLRTPHRLKYGQIPLPWRPKDAFDPEIFNRQVHGPPPQLVPATPPNPPAENNR